MNHSGDAAEQIVRMSLEGAEIGLRITGIAAKEVAAILVNLARQKKNNPKIKSAGEERFKKMLKSGKPTEIFSVKESDLEAFMKGAKSYGITYCVIKDKSLANDGMCDIMVTLEDSPKINRVMERFDYAVVDKAKIERDIVKDRAEKDTGKETEAPDINDTDKLLDDFMTEKEGKKEPEAVLKETQVQTNPEAAKTTKSRQSEPISKSKSKSGEASFRMPLGASEKESVHESIKNIVTQRKKADKPKRDDKSLGEKPKRKKSNTHKQPQNTKKSRTKKSKER